jgi:hypothetical protein
MVNPYEGSESVRGWVVSGDVFVYSLVVGTGEGNGGMSVVNVRQIGSERECVLGQPGLEYFADSDVVVDVRG